MNYCLKQHQIRYQLTQTVSPSSALILDLPILKGHCRLPLDVDFTEDDSTLTIYGKAAEKMVEGHAEICLAAQTFRLDLQYLPKMEPGICQSIVRLETMPVNGISSFKINDTENSLHTISTDYYVPYLSTLPPTVWIDTQGITDICPNHKRLDAYQVTFTAGGSPSATAKEAILFLVGLFYQKREPVHLWSGKMLMEMPLSYQMLIEGCRWRL